MYKDLLTDFYEHAKQVEGNAVTGAFGASWEVLLVIAALEEHLRKWQARLKTESSHQDLADGVDAGYSKLGRYLNNIFHTPAYAAASVLHPRYKYAFFERKWARGNKDYESFLHVLKRNTRTTWAAFKASYPCLPDDSSDSEESPSKRRKTAFDRYTEDDVRQRDKDELQR